MLPSRSRNVTFSGIEAPFALNGFWFAGLEWQGFGVDQLHIFLLSTNVVTGVFRRCYIGDAIAGGNPPRVAGLQKPFLATDGAFAWIDAEREGGEDLSLCGLEGPITLSASAGLLDESVTLIGRTLRWIDSSGEHLLEI